jgi:hypothetical protein
MDFVARARLCYNHSTILQSSDAFEVYQYLPKVRGGMKGKG